MNLPHGYRDVEHRFEDIDFDEQDYERINRVTREFIEDPASETSFRPSLAEKISGTVGICLILGLILWWLS